MKKKINPDDQTKKLSRARWEFLKRNPEAMAEYEESIGYQFRAFCKKCGISDEEAEANIKDSMAVPAAINGTPTLFSSWLKIMREFKPLPIFYSCEEKESKYREQILKDAKDILNRLIFPHPSQSLVIVVNLNRSKEVIMAEVKEIVTDELNRYQKESNRVWLFDEDKKFIGIEQNDKKGRLKWLSNVDEIIQVWDLYEKAGRSPAIISFGRISRKLNRPLSTVKSQWRAAYEKIYGKPYDPEEKYTTHEKKGLADELCAKCPHDFKCYKSKGSDKLLEWIPCAEYLRIAGKEKPNKETIEFHDDIDMAKPQQRKMKKSQNK